MHAYGVSIVTFPNELESTNDILYILDLNLLVMKSSILGTCMPHELNITAPRRSVFKLCCNIFEVFNYKCLTPIIVYNFIFMEFVDELKNFVKDQV